MKLALRSLTVGCFVAALAVAGVAADPSAAEEAGLDFWNVTDNQERMQTEERIRREMDRKDEAVLQRTLTKVAIAHDVVDGKMTFEEGMARFVELNRTNPPIFLNPDTSRELTPDEEAAYQLISYIRTTRKPGAEELAEQWECTLYVPS